MKYLGLDTAVSQKEGFIYYTRIQVYDVDVSDFEDNVPAIPRTFTKPVTEEYSTLVEACKFEEPSAVSRVPTAPIDPATIIDILSRI